MTTEHRAGQRKARSSAGPVRGSKRTRRGVIPRVLERGTAAMEKIHRAVTGFVFDALGRLGRLEKPVARVRKLEDRSITATYELVRGVNRELGSLLRELPVRRPRRPATRRRHPHEPRKVARVEPTPRSVPPAQPAAMTGGR